MKKAVSLFLAFCFAAFMLVAVSVIAYSLNNDTAVYAATGDGSEYDLNWDEADLTEYTVKEKDEPGEPDASSLTAPIAVLAVAAAACIGLGTAYTVITVRRKKK